jgi:hypothetical protein
MSENNSVTINPPSEEEQAAAKAATSVVVANAKALKIKTRDDLSSIGAEALSQVKQQFKKFEDQRVKMKAPILEAGREIDAFFKPFLNELTDAEKIIKSTMITAKGKFDREDEEREARIMARAEKTGKGSLKEETAINQVSEIDRVEKTVKTASGGSSTFKKVQKVTITDLNAIPVEYLRPKTVEEFTDFRPWPAIQKAAKSLDDLIKAGHKVTQIPGVKVDLVDSLSAR